MSTTTLSYTADIRTARRKARRAVRTVIRTIKRTARQRGLTNIPALSKAVGIPLRRVTLMWLGFAPTAGELLGYMIGLKLSAADMFAGTEGRA